MMEHSLVSASIAEVFWHSVFLIRQLSTTVLVACMFAKVYSVAIYQAAFDILEAVITNHVRYRRGC